jgi:hypothetical protein
VRLGLFSIMRAVNPSDARGTQARIVPKFEIADSFSSRLPTQLPSHSYSDGTRERA